MGSEQKITENNADLTSDQLAKTPLPQAFELLIVNMDKVLFDGKVKNIACPVPYGELAIMPGHTPLFTKLSKGKLKVSPESGADQTFEIENGIAKISQFKATILIGF